MLLLLLLLLCRMRRSYLYAADPRSCILLLRACILLKPCQGIRGAVQQLFRENVAGKAGSRETICAGTWVDQSTTTGHVRGAVQ